MATAARLRSICSRDRARVVEILERKEIVRALRNRVYRSDSGGRPSRRATHRTDTTCRPLRRRAPRGRCARRACCSCRSMRCSSCHARLRIITLASGICLRSIGGKRDAVVERVRLVAEEHDLARRVVLAQLFGRGRAGKTVADDDVTATVRDSRQRQIQHHLDSRRRARARRCRSARCGAARRPSRSARTDQEVRSRALLLHERHVFGPHHDVVRVDDVARCPAAAPTSPDHVVARGVVDRRRIPPA